MSMRSKNLVSPSDAARWPLFSYFANQMHRIDYVLSEHDTVSVMGIQDLMNVKREKLFIPVKSTRARDQDSGICPHLLSENYMSCESTVGRQQILVVFIREFTFQCILLIRFRLSACARGIFLAD